MPQSFSLMNIVKLQNLCWFSSSKSLKLRAVFLLWTCLILKSSANTFYIDPINGSDSGTGSMDNPWSTLEYVIEQQLIRSHEYSLPYDPANSQLSVKNPNAPIHEGDTLLLMSGLHGSVYLANYVNEDYITILAAPGQTPIIKFIHLRGAKKWRFVGLTISSEPYGEYINSKLVFLETHNWQGPVSQIDIEGCTLYSTTSPWTTAEDWVNKASDGIMARACSFVNIINNDLQNVRFGIGLNGSNLYAIGNSITNFSGDGIRLVGSNCIIESNVVKNCYQVDGNHDDGIQAFTTGGFVVDNNVIRRNIILNYEDPDQPLLGNLQGIACFDGPIQNWIVENNLVIVDHWHGISLYGATHCSIINNTVLDPSPEDNIGPSWIKIEDLNGYPSSDCIVTNNVANTLTFSTNSTTATNNFELSTYNDYTDNFVSPSAYDFHLQPNSILIDAADGSLAPTDDLEGASRPQGTGFDVGAYEYHFITRLQEGKADESVLLYPNPAKNTVFVKAGNNPIESIQIYDLSGTMLKAFKGSANFMNLDVKDLQAGLYLFRVLTDEHFTVKKLFIQ